MTLKKINFRDPQGRDQETSHFPPFRLFPFSPFRPASSPPFPPDLRVDGLIVLGAGLNPQHQPGRVARLRLLHALHIWRRCNTQIYVLITGGCQPGSPCTEARAMADWALSWVREHCGENVHKALHCSLILEEASHSTAASARHTLPLVQARGSRALGLVSDSLHIPRALLLFKRQFRPRGIVVHPLPARGLIRHYWRNRRYLVLSKIALREGGAWLKALGRLVLRQP